MVIISLHSRLCCDGVRISLKRTERIAELSRSRFMFLRSPASNLQGVGEAQSYESIPLLSESHRKVTRIVLAFS